MSRIRQLSDRLITQISAGEVVERPASVVKELVENSLDAGAGEIRLQLRAGGRELVRVRDNGSGMDPEDVEMAFRRHATSKLSRVEDLQSIQTLGFRGEALAAIAAVAEVEVVSAMQGGEGFRVRVEGGNQVSSEPAPHPRGTTVEVAGLFYNVPARRKFLKQPATEMRRCLEVVHAYALYHRDASFVVDHGGRALLESSAVGAGDHLAALRARIEQLFSSDLAANLIPFGDDPAGDDAVWGMVGNGQTTRGRKSFVFVNGRLVRDRTVMSTFYRAVRDEWGGGEYPSLFLFIHLPSDAVDVNVHPQKHEVRFRDGDFTSRLYRTLRRGLAAARGFEMAPDEHVAALPSAPVAWQGLGRESNAGREQWTLEASVDNAAMDRIAEPTVAGSGPHRVVPLSGRDGVERPFRVLGQYKATLILVEGPDGLYLIDQHVAHERVLYERILQTMSADEVESQRLLSPLLVDLSVSESEALAESASVLAAAGFEYEIMSGATLAVSATPAPLPADEAVEFLMLAARSGAVGEELTARFDEILAAGLSCRAAVKMHDVLNMTELEQLLGELFAAENPYACPHGRPVMLRMSDHELEKSFHRR